MRFYLFEKCYLWFDDWDVFGDDVDDIVIELKVGGGDLCGIIFGVWLY